MLRPVQIDAKKHIYIHGGKLFRVRGLCFGDGHDNLVHIMKEFHQRRAILGREVRLILLDVPPNVQKLVLVLGNAMHKNVE